MTVMTFTHNDIRDRLVDYLYGQLDAEARAAFQAHLDTCATCRQEVSGAEQARVVAREVVRRPLGDAVPERVRARAFEAARAAVARPGGLPAQAKVVAAAAAEGWFTRLRKRWTWTFPTFATVAAMAVFLLVRATIFREAKSPVSAEGTRELAQPEAPGAVPASPGKGGTALDIGRPATDRAAMRDVEASPEAQASGGPPAAAKEADGNDARARLRRSPPTGGARHRGLSSPSEVSSPLGSSGSGAARPAPVAAPVRKPASQSAAAPGAGALGAVQDERLRAGAEKKLAEESNQAELEGAERRADSEAAQAPRRAPAAPKREFATPPPPPAPAAAAPAAGAGAPSMLDLAPDDADAALAGKGSANISAKKSKTARDKEPAAPVAASGSPSRPRDADEAPPSAPDPALARAGRADSLIAERRWGEAIAILRELLRQYPTHASAPRWRQRLATAQAAQAAETGQFAAPPR